MIEVATDMFIESAAVLVLSLLLALSVGVLPAVLHWMNTTWREPVPSSAVPGKHQEQDSDVVS